MEWDLTIFFLQGKDGKKNSPPEKGGWGGGRRAHERELQVERQLQGARATDVHGWHTARRTPHHPVPTEIGFFPPRTPLDYTVRYNGCEIDPPVLRLVLDFDKIETPGVALRKKPADSFRIAPATTAKSGTSTFVRVSLV